MSKNENYLARTFVASTLAGLGCFTAMLVVAALSNHKQVFLAIVLYLGGIVLTSIGVMGFMALLIRRVVVSKRKNRPARTFVALTLSGLGCFTGMLAVAAFSNHKQVLPTIILYYGGIILSSIGVMGFAAVLARRILVSKRPKEMNA